VTFECELENNSNEINDFTNSSKRSNNDEELCTNIPNILRNDPKNIDLNKSFKEITSSNNFNDIT